MPSAQPEALFERMAQAEHPSQVHGVVDPRAYRPLHGDELYDELRVMGRQRGWVRAENLESLPRPAWHLLDLSR